MSGRTRRRPIRISCWRSDMRGRPVAERELRLRIAHRTTRANARAANAAIAARMILPGARISSASESACCRCATARAVTDPSVSPARSSTSAFVSTTTPRFATLIIAPPSNTLDSTGPVIPWLARSSRLRSAPAARSSGLRPSTRALSSTIGLFVKVTVAVSCERSAPMTAGTEPCAGGVAGAGWVCACAATATEQSAAIINVRRNPSFMRAPRSSAVSYEAPRLPIPLR